MAKTITLDGARLHEVRVTLASGGDPIVQASFSLLSGSILVHTVNLQNLSAQLEQSEQDAAIALFAAVGQALSRIELS